MRKALFVLTIAMSTFLWMGRSEPAYAKILACQGSPAIGGQTLIGTSATGSGELVPVPFLVNGAAVFIGANAALWSVTISNSKFTGGNLTATVHLTPASTLVDTCFYTLDSTSSFVSNSGTVQQTLIWDPVSGNPPSCSGQFTDQVYLVSNGAAAVMVDDNLAGKEVPGSGTCIWH